ncbi:MAG TPA: FkbM family methyltransferase, partial [Gammaproteobacteria bacterium]
SELTAEDIGGGINLLDLGASGAVPAYWKPLAHLTNLVGFDPNRDECRRLENQESEFLSQRFLPYAIAGEENMFTLFKTNNIYCWSLLEPNTDWLRRFSISERFEVKDAEEMPARTLGGIPELENADIDAMKIDTQGLELPILNSAEDIVRDCILIETETGFCENYLGETTFDQIMEYMRAMGFGLFDINASHRVSRANAFSNKTRNEQILWCEAIWLRDFCQIDANHMARVSRQKALKALCIFANHGCVSFGLEAAGCFADHGILSSGELQSLSDDTASWAIGKRKRAASIKSAALKTILNLIPRRHYGEIHEALRELRDTEHPLSGIARRND